jgi:hypothetical protein
MFSRKSKHNGLTPYDLYSYGLALLRDHKETLATGGGALLCAVLAYVLIVLTFSL